MDVPIIDTLQRLLQRDARARVLIRDASDTWKSGKLWRVEAETLTDVPDGNVCRFHPELMKKAVEPCDAIPELRLAIGIYQDGIEPCNTLGYAKGKHKVVCFYYTIINLPPRLRFALSMMQMFTLTNAETMKRYGAARILSGVDSGGVVHSDELSCFKQQMDRLSGGVVIDVPRDGEIPVGSSRMEKVRIRAFLVLVQADYEARMQMLPFMDGVGAHQNCAHCNFQSRRKNANKPTLFENQREGAIDETGLLTLRKIETVQEDVAALRKLEPTLSKEKRSEHTRNTGVSKTVYALDPAYLLNVNPIRMSTQDFMHVEGDGNIMYEASQMFYVHIRVHKFYTYDALVCAFQEYDFPPGHRIPPPHVGVTKGTQEGNPYANAHVHWSASQAFHFVSYRCVLVRTS